MSITPEQRAKSITSKFWPCEPIGDDGNIEQMIAEQIRAAVIADHVDTDTIVFNAENKTRAVVVALSRLIDAVAVERNVHDELMRSGYRGWLRKDHEDAMATTVIRENIARALLRTIEDK